MSTADEKAKLLGNLPPKMGDWLDLSPGSDPDKVIEASAQGTSEAIVDNLDALAADANPLTATATGIVNWEGAFAVSASPTTVYGSLAERRAQILARHRESGASTLANVQAALIAVTGNATSVTIIEHDRATLRGLNTHSFPTLTATVGNTASASLAIGDNALASDAGLQLQLNISTGDEGTFSVTLIAPDAQQFTPSGVIVDGADHWYYWPEFAGGVIDGTWSISVDNTNGGATDVQVDAANVFVGGIGRDVATGAEGLEANIFEWNALIDESLVSSTYSRLLAQEIVRRWDLAHTRGYLALKQTNGDTGAVCGDANCIAGMTVCGN